MPPKGQKGNKGNKPFYEGMGMAQTPDISELLTGSMDLADYKINGFTMRTMTVTVWNTWSTAKIPLTR